MYNSSAYIHALNTITVDTRQPAEIKQIRPPVRVHNGKNSPPPLEPNDIWQLVHLETIYSQVRWSRSEVRLRQVPK